MSNQMREPPAGENHQHARHLFILIDGTWVTASNKSPGEQQSNIYWLNCFLESANKEGETQIVFYIPGIGSSTEGDKLFGGGLAFKLERFVEAAYLNIISNFRVTDKIYIFGFSRGAVIARLVAYMISTFGVLKLQEIDRYQKMWEFVNGDNISKPDIDLIKQYCFTDVKIEFLGLFDTVPGFIWEKRLANTVRNKIFKIRTLPRSIKCAVHILAMHESRVEFLPVLFTGVEDKEQQLEQIWMPGVHSDVGNGYVQDFLGNISLLTMLDRLIEKTSSSAGPQIALNEKRLTGLKNQIEGVKNNGHFVINNELGKWWNWPISRLYGKLGRRQRKPTEGDKDQYYHEFCRELDNKLIELKSVRDQTFKMEKFYNKGWPKFPFAPPVKL
jgi:uncharacterized protein (DUF2235 family)